MLLVALSRSWSPRILSRSAILASTAVFFRGLRVGLEGLGFGVQGVRIWRARAHPVVTPKPQILKGLGFRV